ncbi:MAG: M48 family metalloprotease [Halothece sp.]
MSFSENYQIILSAAKQALAAREYESAIAQFENICENSNDQTLISTAKKGLVSAYLKSGKTEKAIQLCEEIKQTGDISNQVWARRQLKEIKTSENLSTTTGFVVDTTPSEVSPPPAKGNQSFPKEPPSKTPKKKLNPSSQLNKKLPQKQEKSKQKANPKPLNPLSKPTIKRDWRNQPSAENWQPLLIKFRLRFWLQVAISLVAFFWLFRTSIEIFMELTNDLLVSLPYFNPFQPFYRDSTRALIIFLVFVSLVSPWWLDGLISIFYQGRKLSLSELLTRCPETGKLLRNHCRQHQIPFPRFSLLPITSPVIFSYGHLPKNTRIVVSEGLLSQLEDEEIATLLAGELGMSRYGLFPILSSAIALLQIPYTLYSQIAYWGEKGYQKMLKQSPRFIPNWIWCDIPPLIRNSSAIISNFFYLAYRLWQLPLNWIFQAQHFYRDQFSVSLTGNPNAKVRGLIKLTFGITHGIEVEKQTPYLLESFNPLFPIGYRQGLYLGSLCEHLPLETILNRELSQPYRHYLNGFNSHPLISDRAFNLLQFAKKYQLPLELEISNPHPSSRNWIDRIKTLSSAYRVFPLLQKSLYLGIILGLILRLFFWGIGIISEPLDIFYLSWLAEAETILNASILFAFSLSLLIGINHYFPNLKLSNENNNPNLSQWLTQINHPQEVASLRIEGQLFGRSGISNWLGQDLILKTETGMIPLHFSSRLGIIGNTLPNFSRPNQLIQQPVIVSGWLRRSVIPWLDVERITYNQHHSIQAHYPIWLTIIAMGAAIWGAQLILQA